MKEIKKISIKEFRKSGYLQELNRRFLHPLGLALEVFIDDDGNESLSGIWDYREDKEGIIYDINNSDEERKEKFKKNKEFIDYQFKKKLEERKNKIGYEIESIPNSPEILDSKFLSLAAEYDNYKKRSLKDKSDSMNDLKIKLLSSIIDIDNDLSIALKSVNSDESIDGIKLIIKKISYFLKSQGIEEIQTKTYDSDLHHVISVVPSDEDKIIEVISKGYSLDGKPFKYPKIILGKMNS